MTIKKAFEVARRMTSEPQINLNINGRKLTVPRSAYIKSKTKQLVEFGYPSLTEEETGRQLDLVLAGNRIGQNGLNVIGGFMLGEVIVKSVQKGGE